jgi:hypothetical protein
VDLPVGGGQISTTLEKGAQAAAEVVEEDSKGKGLGRSL